MHPRKLVAPALLALLVTAGAATPASARSSVAASELPAIHLRVVDAQTALPVAGAEVLVNFVEGDPDHPIVTGEFYNLSTNGGGNALLKGVGPGIYVISVGADGYVKFGDGAHGDRPPTGLTVIFGVFSHGAGAAGNTGVHAVIRLVPLCRDCL